MSARLTLRKRAGLLLLRLCGRVALFGLRLYGASSLLVETPEYVREREEAAQRMREAFTRALVGPPVPGIAGAADPQRQCSCPRCTQARSQAASRWN